MPATVISCKRMWEQLGGEFGEGGETLTIGFLVRLSEPSPLLAPRLARGALSFSRGDTFAEAFPEEIEEEDASGMVCQTINAGVRQDAPEFVDVTARFAVPARAQGVGGFIINPLERPVVPEWVIEEESETPVKDVDGKKIVNAADEPFDPGVTRYVGRPILRLRKNVAIADFTAAWLLGIVGTCNSDPFYGATAGQARIRGASAQRLEESGYAFWGIQVEVALRKEGWRSVDIRNRGRRTKTTWTNPDYGTIVDYQPILGSDGQPIDEPADLGLDGKALATGATPTSITFHLYEEIAFAPLGLT